MSFKHKHKSSNCPEELSYSVFADTPGGMQRQESASLIASPTQSSSTTIMRKVSSKATDDRGSIEQNLHATPSTSGIAGTDIQPEAVFVIRGTRVRACLTRLGLQLTALQGPLLPCIGRAVLGLLPFDEILAAEVAQRNSVWRSTCCTGRTHVLLIHTIKRALHNKSQWQQRTIQMTTAEAEVAQEWASRIQAAIKALPQRPRSLLVIVNPYGGAKQAGRIWARTVLPIFQRAGVSYTTLATEWEGHAREMVEQMPLTELQTYDGVIAVGGDGLFQEIMNGVLAVRARSREDSSAMQQLRLGHIPAGSTDAVAYSLNGTRSQATAALHIALGDRMAMDVMRVDTADGHHRFSVCVASYGYMGDLMRFSEKLRWMGPPRYNTAGTIMLLRGRAYRAKVSYMPVDTKRFSVDVRRVCRSQCDLCRLSPDRAHGDPLAFTQPATEALNHGAWKTIEGEFKGIMAVVTPCRSDRSTLGLFPYGHLNDGRLHLILIRNCSVLQYLRFLASIPQTGVEPDMFPYVEVIDVTAVQVIPTTGPESCWNVDGEVLADNRFTGQVHRGLLEVFARGVE